jgi:carbon storage regulator
MLVLSRKVNESIMIGDGVQITVVEISNGRVQLGIVAPVEVPIHRREVYDSIKREQERGNDGPTT